MTVFPEQGRGRWRPAVVLLLGLCLSAAAGLWRQAHNDEEAQTRIEETSRVISVELAQRLNHIRHGLEALKALYASNPTFTRADFRTYVASRDLPNNFSGIQAFAFVQRVLPSELTAFIAAQRADGAAGFAPQQMADKSQADMYLVKFSEPRSSKDWGPGTDLGSEPVRRLALQRAVDSGQAALTSTIRLRRDQNEQPGLLLFIPVYANGAIPTSVQARRASLVGLMYAPMVIPEFFQNLAGVEADMVDVDLYDASANTPDAKPIFDSHQRGGSLQSGSAAKYRFHTRQTVKLIDRDWVLQVNSAPRFDASVDRASAWLAFAISALTSLALAAWLRGSLLRNNLILKLVDERTGELQKEQARLQRSESHSRAITEAAHDAIVTVSCAGNIIAWNHAAQTTFGHTGSEVMNQPFTMLVPERYREQYLRGWMRVGSSSEPRVTGKTVELHGLHKDASEFPLEVALSMWKSDQTWFITSIMRNITERKVQEQQLGQQQADLRTQLSELVVAKAVIQKSDQFKQAIINSIGDQIVVIDQRGTIVQFNQAWQQSGLENGLDPDQPSSATGLGSNYLAAIAAASLVWPPDVTASEAEAGISAVMEGHLARFQMEYRCDSPQQKRWFEMSVTPLEMGAVIVHRNVSDFKELQLSLEKARLADELVVTNQQLSLESREKSLRAVELVAARQAAEAANLA
ncbi:MAG: CHASE domain-containing protein, partial [Comamonadaceae bacterium]